MFAEEGVRAGYRFRLEDLGGAVERRARHWGIDAAALAAVLAVEMHARGPIWRTLEQVVAQAFLVLGLAVRVERMSFGIAQIQARQVPDPPELRDRLRRLRRAPDSIDLCAQILAGICCESNLPMEARKWCRNDWFVVASEYGGDYRYADALISAYSVLLEARRPFSGPWSVELGALRSA